MFIGYALSISASAKTRPPAAGTFLYLQPGGVDTYLQPGGVDGYRQPA